MSEPVHEGDGNTFNAADAFSLLFLFLKCCQYLRHALERLFPKNFIVLAAIPIRKEEINGSLTASQQNTMEAASLNFV